MNVSVDKLRDLAMIEPGEPVLTVYVRTDPRDAANTAATPGWEIELRNELKAAADDPDGPLAGDLRGDLAARDLADRIAREARELDPNDRGRGLVWFATPSGGLDERFTLQLPPRRTLALWDVRPFVSPLVDIVDRGRPAGVALLSNDAVRLLRWQAGRVDEPERPLYEIGSGEWRDVTPYVGHGSPGQGSMHVGTASERVDERREKFMTDAAGAVAEHLSDTGWQRLVVVGEPRLLNPFLAKLPTSLRERVVATVDANLIWAEPAAVAERIERALDDAWRRDTRDTVVGAIEAARAGGAGAVGWPEVLDCLARRQADRVIFLPDAAPDPASLDPHTRQALGDPPAALVVERAVELAVAAATGVTVAQSDLEALAAAGGAVATLRY